MWHKLIAVVHITLFTKLNKKKTLKKTVLP